jgi:hypothetical protein
MGLRGPESNTALIEAYRSFQKKLNLERIN